MSRFLGCLFLATALQANPYSRYAELKQTIVLAAEMYNVDPRLLIAQAYAESSMRPKAVNVNERIGGPSYGLFQIQEGTAWDHCRLKVRYLLNPVWNARCAAIIHRNYMLKYRGDRHAKIKALLSYNAGGFYLCKKSHLRIGRECKLGVPVNIDYLFRVVYHYHNLIFSQKKMSIKNKSTSILDLTMSFIDNYTGAR